MPTTALDRSIICTESEYLREVAKEIQRWALSACERSAQLIRECEAAVSTIQEVRENR